MKVLSHGIDVRGTVQARALLIVPVLAADPGAPADGNVWVNSTDHVLRYREAGSTVTVATSTLDVEGIRDAIGAALVAGNNIDITVDDGSNTITIDVENLTSADLSDFTAAVQAVSIDADTLEGQSVAALTTSITAAIVDGSPGTLDTLNELAAAIGDDANFSTTLTALAGSRARTYDEILDGGALTEVVTHNLNTRLLNATVYVNSGSYEEEDYIIQHTSVNTITVVSEGQNIPAGRAIFLVAKGT